MSGQEKIRFRDSNRQMMLERSYCTALETIKQVQGKIIIVPNSKIFDFENITVEDSKIN